MISGSRRGSGATMPGPERAVIDIGSNTVRLVVYSGPRRAPIVWLNEKVTARLGRDLAETGRMPEKAIELALRGLARFAAILNDIGVGDVEVVATAAVRDAENGPEFVEQVRALGLDVRVLSGEEEASAAAWGVIGAFPEAHGVVADLGGGSLELIGIGESTCSQGVSLPLGTLRLPALRAKGPAGFRKAVEDELAKARWAVDHEGPLYLVGGTWRALAKFAMNAQGYPLSDPHAYRLAPDEADHFAKQAAQMSVEELAAIPGVSSSRAAGLADACAMLRPLIAELKPEALVFSSWGLREGLLHAKLTPLERKKDPLLSGVEHFTRPRGVTATQAALIAGWTAAVARGGVGEEERLRTAATMLALAAAHIEPNMRIAHCTDWALHKRWIGLDHRGRALIAAALRGACGKPEPTAPLKELASSEDLRRAAGWGLAIRLCRRLGAGSRLSLLTSKLTRAEDSLTLWIDPSREQLRSTSVENDLKSLARWLDLEWRME